MLENWDTEQDLPEKFLNLLHSKASKSRWSVDFDTITEKHDEALDCLALAEICLKFNIAYGIYLKAKKKLFQ